MCGQSALVHSCWSTHNSAHRVTKQQTQHQGTRTHRTAHPHKQIVHIYSQGRPTHQDTHPAQTRGTGRWRGAGLPRRCRHQSTASGPTARAAAGRRRPQTGCAAPPAGTKGQQRLLKHRQPANSVPGETQCFVLPSANRANSSSGGKQRAVGLPFRQSVPPLPPPRRPGARRQTTRRRPGRRRGTRPSCPAAGEERRDRRRAGPLRSAGEEVQSGDESSLKSGDESSKWGHRSLWQL